MKKHIEELKKNENVRANLSAIRQSINDEGGTELLLSYFSVEEILDFLKRDDAKTRKNAALLLGEIREAIEDDTLLKKVSDALIEGYMNDGTLFTKSSYLKALGKYPLEDYREVLTKRLEELMRYVPEEDEKKHLALERHELDMILEGTQKNTRHKFTGYNIKQEIVLVTNPLVYESLGATLRGIRTKRHPFGIALISESLKPILALRYYREVLFIQRLKVLTKITDTPETIAKNLLDSGLYEGIKNRHAPSDEAFRFRLELKNAPDVDETKIIKKIALELEEGSRYKLKNSANDYELIIKLVVDRSQKIHTFVRYLTIPDKRFTYRKNSIAASIHPANAALLMNLAAPYLKDNAQVIDPCCGVATMLVERNLIKPLREVYAIDTFGEAIDKAKENVKAAGLSVNFIHRDYLDFTHEYPFDEIIANMPVRGKKTKEEQDAFYDGFFSKSAEILAPGGIMILYSNEKGFIFKQLRVKSGFSLLKEFVIRERDGFGLYIIKYS
ncbi:MAG: methyltransferase [Lachnospiraceae bacterium]|nr:methyltransferase [Lachnospiraceae bacterium]